MTTANILMREDHTAVVTELVSGEALQPGWQRMRATLRARLGEEVYSAWFGSMEPDARNGTTLRLSVPVKFLKNWIQSHYADQILTTAKREFPGVERVEVVLRQPQVQQARGNSETQSGSRAAGAPAPATQDDRRGVAQSRSGAAAPVLRTSGNGYDSSSLDARYTFENFVVGSANRIPHAAAIQVAETVFSDERSFNPLYLHSAVGLGKSHLLHAIAWEVRRRAPNANVLYLTAERFRYQFVESLKSQDALSFKDRFRSVDILLIDDLEFMQGERTEQEFEHIINALLDAGKQVVVAAARAPAQMERLNERMRSRLSRGLVTEIHAPDGDLRLKILERRAQERRQVDPSFEIPRPVLDLIAERLTESGRELEGAVTRLYAAWQLVRAPISLESAETIIRDMLQGIEPRRIKIEDIIRVVSRHYAVSKADILSERRHRSIVYPRQIGMYLAKQLTSRSLPEIGRRFGDRDHTTVLHAIRKIDKDLENNMRLREELEELKKQLNHR